MDPRKPIYSIHNLLIEALERIESIYSKNEIGDGFATGLQKLDEMIAGLKPADLIILAARPSMGSTGLALHLTRSAAVEANRPVMYLAPQTTKEALSMKLLCKEAKVDWQRLRIGAMSDEEWGRLAQGAGLLSDSDLFIDDKGFLDDEELIQSIEAVQSELKSQDKHLGLIVIDALDERRLPELGGGEFLKQLAKKYNLPILVLCGLGSEIDKRTNPRPLLSDLAPWRGMESNADLVMFLYRDEFYQEDSDDRNVAELIIAKNRRGPTGLMRLRFDPVFSGFSELHREAENGHTEPTRKKNKQVFFACWDGFSSARTVTRLLHENTPGGLSLEELLEDPSLDRSDRDEIQCIARAGYKAFFIGGTYCLRRKDRFVSVDLDQLGNLFGPTNRYAADLLFEGFDADETSFDWKALAGLIASDPTNLISWGDGTISNGNWLIIAPEARGLLGLKFSAPNHRTWTHEEDYTHLLDHGGMRESALITSTQDQHVLKVNPCGTLVNRSYVEGILAALGASSHDLGRVKVYAKEAHGRVTFSVEGKVRAALMPRAW